mgnify:CR=1 FL=1
MARSTFKVLFYVLGSKEKNGIVPIMGRVTINGTVAQFSCKQSIPKTQGAAFRQHLKMEHKEDKRSNKGGRSKKGATDKMTYRVAVKMSAVICYAKNSSKNQI